MASSTLQNFEQLSYGPAALSMHRAKATQFIGDAVAARTLTAKESGATCLFDAATVVYTLPAPVIGMEFEFLTTATATSHKVITDAATTFLVGQVAASSAVAGAGNSFPFNGTTHVACTSNGTTTGGIVGGRIKVRALSATQWFIEGMMIGSGTLATPAATS